MRKLIKGQTIQVDNHKSGTQESVEWGKGVHLDKAMNDDKYRNVRVKVYLDSDKVEFIDKGNDKISKRMMNEISDVLEKNPQKRKAFVQDVIREIDRFSQTLSAEERKKNLLDGAKRIAKHFELIHFEREIENNVSRCLTEHYDKENKVCYILQDLREKTITIGENKALVKDKALFNGK